MDLILFGIQGSGKGTLGQSVAKKFGYRIFETGARLRELAKQQTELGIKIKKTLEAGQLASDELIMEILDEYLISLPENVNLLFDGLPRTLNQAQQLEKALNKYNRPYMGILIDVPESTSIKRLSSRRICGDCRAIYTADYNSDFCSECQGKLITRDDDNPESIKKRIATFYKLTLPAIDHFDRTGKIITMDGDRSIEDTKTTIFSIVEELNSLSIVK